IQEKGKIFILKDGDSLFAAGVPYQHQLYVLLDGIITIQRKHGQVNPLQPGEFIGLSNYLDKSPYTATAVAEGDCTILRFTDNVFHKLEQRYSELSHLVDHIIGKRIRNRTTTSHPVSGVMGQPVYTVMTSPLAQCDVQTTIGDAYNIMQERKIGSLAVFKDEKKLIGMLTFAGLCGALVNKQAGAETLVAEAACETPVCVSYIDPLWHAEDKLQSHHIKYLVVTREGAPVGLISQTDLFKARVKHQNIIIEQIRDADSLSALRNFYNAMYEMARDAHERNHHAVQAVQEISEIHLAIQRRCVELTLLDLEQRGLGPAPRNYSLLIMGSGGRREMLLTPDQDNGLIIDDNPGELTVEETNWFKTFSEQLNINLDKAGYILCPGDIMARNPMFHKTLSQWRKQISHMVRQPNNKSARWGNIVFDFTTLYGDDMLTRKLREHLLAELQQFDTLLGYMVEDDAEGRPPLGFFNQLLTMEDETHKGKIDIKRNGLRLIADAARIYALHAGLAETNTRERLKVLVHLGILNRDLVDSILAAFDELLHLLIVHQIEQVEQQQVPDKFIKPDALPWQTRSVLRVSMRAIKRLQDQLQGQFGRSAF
ncbi:MAG: CBS domain-containing protein, partial [Halobacteria archaeon]|nr:CBS domain-containing protein [Halobacteria archaeon]